MDFIDAAQSEEEPAIIYLSSEEDDQMHCISSDSVDDLVSSSDEEREEIQLMARSVERQLADPIPIPVAGPSDSQTRCPTPRPNPGRPPFPTFSPRCFNLGNGNGPLAWDHRVRNNHPINVCRNLVPQLDTPLSPPAADKGPDNGASSPSYSYSNETVTVDSISNHFRGMALSEESMLVNYSDCVVCGKTGSQIQSEAVNDYLSRTVVSGETLAERATWKRAFLDGMSAGTFLLMPGGVSQAASCDGNWYSIAYNHYNTLPGTIPSFEESGHVVQKDKTKLTKSFFNNHYFILLPLI